jgi:hypothetical protein
MNNSQINVLEQWIRKHSHNERVFILLFGWLIIFVIWYVIVAIPLFNARLTIASKLGEVTSTYAQTYIEIDSLQKRATQSAQLKKQKIKEALQQQKAKPIKTNIESADRLIRQFFNLDTGIKAITLQSASLKVEGSTVANYSFAIQFTSGYFETMSYLGRLENLPWCLAWDSLDYKVVGYPDAVVIVKLHTLNDV